MAKIINPVRFSEHFNVSPQLLEELGVLNPCLSVDTKLFIDPLLLKKSNHNEMSLGARITYEKHFLNVIKLLLNSREHNDMAWRNAVRQLSFPEIKGTCLGYGASSISGSGAGKGMTSHLVRTAKAIVDLGINDPDLFVAMALFEEGFGPDRISDMTTNVILSDLLKFNKRILKILSIPCSVISIASNNTECRDILLPVNPYLKNQTPIILVPTDILRDLPIAKDWEDISSAASHNSVLRNSINQDIAKLWKYKRLKDKKKIKDWALKSKDNFTNFMEMVHSSNGASYNVSLDSQGELVWREVANTIAQKEPCHIDQPKDLNIAGIMNVVDQIIQQFQFLIEDRRLSEELYYRDEKERIKPRPEKSAQRLFFAVAYAYCKANNLDITPESDTGNGPVDFKFSQGFSGRVLVEIKLSINPKLLSGYTRQLETYKKAEETTLGYYLVIDVGKFTASKQKQLNEKMLKEVGNASKIIIIDGSRRNSASKL